MVFSALMEIPSTTTANTPDTFRNSSPKTYNQIPFYNVIRKKLNLHGLSNFSIHQFANSRHFVTPLQSQWLLENILDWGDIKMPVRCVWIS
jgi:hypothetical protein